MLFMDCQGHSMSTFNSSSAQAYWKCQQHWPTDVQGMPAKDLWKEVSSYDTVGNAYFAFSIHALPAGWR